MEFAEFIATPKIDGVTLHRPFHDPVNGTLCVTGHHLILSTRKEAAQELWLLHQSIDSVEKRPATAGPSPSGGSLVIKCKDFRIIQLDISNTEEFLNVYSSIENLSNLETADRLYPFFYRPIENILEDGHTLFKLESEFAKLLASDEWRVSTANKNYSLCSSYSSVIVVPKSIDDDVIVASAGFRDGGRFPVLSYRHDNGAVLLRSGQPLLNNSNRRSRADEKMLNAVLGAGKKGYIIDTRSTNYASYCKGKGGGTEPEAHYTQWKKVHKPLDKIVKCEGALSDSLSKLVDACNDTKCSSDKWLSRLESSNWLSYVQNAQNASCLVAQCLDQDGASVLVHGSSGLDSTLLLTSVAQVILNPDCRTVRGLQALIEREWIQAGHPFQQRHSKCCYSKTKHQQPTFLLFLDCVQQLHYQFPCSFEFTTQMLVLLFEHSYYSQFGSFLGNHEQDREILKVTAKTTSLWSYLNRPDVLTSLLNPLYEPNKAPIWPSVAPVSIVLWSSLFLRWAINQSEVNKCLRKIQNIIEYDKKLKNVAIKLRKEVLELQKELDRRCDD